MGNFWDNWARAHRNATAFFAVIALTLLFGRYAYIEVERRSQPPPIVETVTARVKEVKKFHSGKVPTRFGEPDERVIFKSLLVLPNGDEVEITFFNTPPEVGEEVPLIVERYADGRRIYNVDRIKWLSGE